MVQGYCLKDKKKVEIKDPVEDVNKRGQPFAKGKCPSCGGPVYRILSMDEASPNIQEKAKKIKAQRAKKGGSRRSRRSKKSQDAAPKRKSRKSRKSRGSRKSRRSRKSRK